MFSSSVNPQQLSTTVESILKIAAGLAASAGMSAVVPDITTAQTQLQALIDVGVQMTPLVYAAWHAANVLFGLARKVFVFIHSKFSPQQ